MTDPKRKKNSRPADKRPSAAPDAAGKCSAEKPQDSPELSENNTESADTLPARGSATCSTSLSEAPTLSESDSAESVSQPENDSECKQTNSADNHPEDKQTSSDNNSEGEPANSANDSESVSGSSSRTITDTERTDRIIRITDRIVERLSEAVEILDPDDTQHMKQIVSSLSEIIDIRKQSSSEASVITVNFEGDEDYSG